MSTRTVPSPRSSVVTSPAGVSQRTTSPAMLMLRTNTAAQRTPLPHISGSVPSAFTTRSRKSACSERWMRRMPSAPTPVWRAQAAGASDAQSTASGSRSSTTRKSFPSPCILVKNIDDLAGEPVHGSGVALQPADPTVAPEPGALRLRISQGTTHQQVDRAIDIGDAVEDGERLAVADPRGVEGGAPDPAGERRLDLGEQSAVAEQPAAALLDQPAVELGGGVEGERRRRRPAAASPCRQGAMGVEDLERPHHPARVAPVAARRSGGIATGELGGELGEALGPLGEGEAPLPGHRVGLDTGEVEPVDEGADVEAGAADDQGQRAAAVDVLDGGAGEAQPGGDGEGLAGVAHREQVAGHPAQLGRGRRAGPDHEPPDHLAGVGVHQLNRAEAFGDGDGERRLARRRRTADDEEVRRAAHGRRKARRRARSSRSTAVGRPWGQVVPPGVSTRRSRSRCCSAAASGSPKRTALWQASSAATRWRRSAAAPRSVSSRVSRSSSRSRPTSAPAQAAGTAVQRSVRGPNSSTAKPTASTSPACSASRAIAPASTSTRTGSRSSCDPAGPGRGAAAPSSQPARSSAYSTFSWAAWGSTRTTPSGDSATIQVVPTWPRLRSGESAATPPGGAVPPASAAAASAQTPGVPPAAGAGGRVHGAGRPAYPWTRGASCRASAASGRAPSPSSPSQCAAALCGRPRCTAAQQARCTAANTRPSSRKRTSRLAGWTLTSTSAGSSRTTTTPKGWRPPGSRPRYASSTATVRARLWTRRPLTTSTTPPRAARWARGSEIAPPTST